MNLTDDLNRVRNAATYYLAEIQALFVPGTKILVVTVVPTHPDRQWMLGDATPEEAIAALQYLKTEGTEHA